MQVLKEIKLTKDQQLVHDKVTGWAMMTDVPVSVTISGNAGTGKTTVLSEIIKTLDGKLKIAVTAPTHKAKKVIADKCGKPAETLQKLLGLKPSADPLKFDPIRLEFEPLGEAGIQDYDLIICDECSMINKKLADTLKDKAKQYGAKILFVGDNLQLPPINEQISETFQHNVVGLTQVVRQAHDNPLLHLLSQIREDILNETLHYEDLLDESHVNDKGEGYIIYRDKKVFTEKSLEVMSQDAINNKCVAWTNQTVETWSKWLRSKIIKSDEQLVVGDFLVGYNTVRNGDSQIIVNSEDYEVLLADKGTNNHKFDIYKVKLRNVQTGEISPILHIVRESSMKHYKNLINIKINRAKKFREWKAYFSFKETNLIMSSIPKVASKDLDYFYGITVHKTQGSTYDNVFVNLVDIRYNKREEEMLKLIYVALSRPRKIAHIYLE